MSIGLEARARRRALANSAWKWIGLQTIGASLADYPDRSQLQQIIAGITEGVILIEPDQAVTYANRAALAMHGVQDLDRAVQRSLNAFV